MSIMERLEKVLDTLPDDRLREVLDYAEFLSWRDESEAWRTFGKSQLANAYGSNEPDYSIADLKKEADA